jgi:hypothetical protein
MPIDIVNKTEVIETLEKSYEFLSKESKDSIHKMVEQLKENGMGIDAKQLMRNKKERSKGIKVSFDIARTIIIRKRLYSQLLIKSIGNAFILNFSRFNFFQKWNNTIEPFFKDKDKFNEYEEKWLKGIISRCEHYNLKELIALYSSTVTPIESWIENNLKKLPTIEDKKKHYSSVEGFSEVISQKARELMMDVTIKYGVKELPKELAEIYGNKIAEFIHNKHDDIVKRWSDDKLYPALEKIKDKKSSLLVKRIGEVEFDNMLIEKKFTDRFIKNMTEEDSVFIFEKYLNEDYDLPAFWGRTIGLSIDRMKELLDENIWSNPKFQRFVEDAYPILKKKMLEKDVEDRKRMLNPEDTTQEVDNLSKTTPKSERVSKNAILFIDCYWDKKENLFVRCWRYQETTGGMTGRAVYPANESEPLYGFAIPNEEKEEIDTQIKTGTIERSRILKQHHFGKWEKVIDEIFVQFWRKHSHNDKIRHAMNFLKEINSGEYIALRTELERLAVFETEDRKSLGTVDIIKDYFGSKRLYEQKDEPAAIREMERTSLKSIIKDFEKWFYSHGIDPTKIVSDVVNTNVSELKDVKQEVKDESVKVKKENGLISEDVINEIYRLCKKDMEEHPKTKSASYKLIREYLDSNKLVSNKKLDSETKRIRSLVNRRLKNVIKKRRKKIPRFVNK